MLQYVALFQHGFSCCLCTSWSWCPGPCSSLSTGPIYIPYMSFLPAGPLSRSDLLLCTGAFLVYRCGRGVGQCGKKLDPGSSLRYRFITHYSHLWELMYLHKNIYPWTSDWYRTDLHIMLRLFWAPNGNRLTTCAISQGTKKKKYWFPSHLP
jgi:hypothetical protein